MPPANERALHFTRIRLENWRNFREVSVDLQERVFLVGPNGAGKSNFLDAFLFLHDLVSVGGGLQAAVEKRGGVRMLRHFAAPQDAEVGLRVTVGNSDVQDCWEYEIRLREDPEQGVSLSKERVLQDGGEILSRPTTTDQRDPRQLTQTDLEQTKANQKFRELADFFASARFLHIVPQLVREPERSAGRRNDPYGSDFLEQIAKSPAGSQKAFLEKIVKALRLAVPQLPGLELAQDARGTTRLRIRVEQLPSQGPWATEKELSDGTIRLIGLLWALLESPGPLILEEPEQSLHPRVVRLLPPLFHLTKGRTGGQVLLSTHSPELLQDEGLGLNEILLLQPEAGGTTVLPAGSDRQIQALVEGGLNLAEAVQGMAEPEDAGQIPLQFAS